MRLLRLLLRELLLKWLGVVGKTDTGFRRKQCCIRVSLVGILYSSSHNTGRALALFTLLNKLFSVYSLSLVVLVIERTVIVKFLKGKGKFYHVNIVKVASLWKMLELLGKSIKYDESGWKDR